MTSVARALRTRAREHPERAAIISGTRAISYGELWERVQATAALFESRGVVPGDRIQIVASTTSPTFAYAYLGAHLAGALTVPVDPAAPALRHQQIAAFSGARLVVGSEAAPESALGALRLDELEAAPASSRAFADPDESALADLLFTTGTSGLPKGVMLTHRGVVAAANHINATLGNGAEDVEVVPLPLSHSFGLGRLRCNLLAGGTLVLTQGFKLPGEIFSALKQHRATGLVGVPAGFAVLLRFGERGLGAYAEKLRYVEIGSAAMRLDDKHALMRLLPRTRLFMHYGLTEASRSAFIEFHRDAAHLESVGRPAPGVEMEIRDERGEPCPIGVTGALWIRGGHVATGYWSDPERSGKVFIDGWVRTDDVAELDAEGFLTLRGRKDDMMNVGGFNVFPEEVERVLEGHSAVAEAGCIGIPDPRGIAGQIIRAHLILARGQVQASDDELRAWTAARLEPYKVPLQFEWLEALPRTSSGKLQRGTLRARLETTT